MTDQGTVGQREAAAPAMRYFIGMGATRAGSTWLHHQLSLHPQIAVPPRKELHYFDRVASKRTSANYNELFINAIRTQASRYDEDPRLAKTEITALCDLLSLGQRSPQEYREYLDSLTTDESLVVGETSPGYSALGDDGMALMRDVLDPKVILIMRDPLARHWSEVRTATRNPARLEAAFTHRHTGRLARGDYRSTIETVERHFAPDQVLYLFYEELVSEETLRRVGAFLQVSPTWGWDVTRRSNVGQEATMPEPSEELLSWLQPTYEFVHERFGPAVPDSWRR